MRWVCFVFTLLIACFSIAQNTIGIPSIVNYSKQAYNAGNQNWAITQDADGIMYFANNKGLLTFDGKYWRTYELPNKTIVRSVAIAADRKIYVGGQQEMGYFSPDKAGELQYHSSKTLLPEADQNFADIWGISIFNNQVFFRSNRKMFRLANGRFNVYDGTNWRFLATTKNGLIAYDFSKGLVRFVKDKWVACQHQSILPATVYVRAATDMPDGSVLLATFEHGLYKLLGDSVSAFTTPDISTIAAKKIYGCCPIAADKIAFITSLAGCIVADTAGNIVQSISKQEGIQNNNVLSVFADREQNLWLGLDNGIDMVKYNNAIKNIFPDQNDRNSGYASIIYNHYLYVGLSTGVYYVKLDSNVADVSFTKGHFTEVINTTGRVWSLNNIDGKLLAGHNNGGYLITGQTATPIDTKTGVWGFHALQNSGTLPMVIAGTYTGIDFYTLQNGVLSTPPKRVPFESARFIVREGNTLLVAHPYKGLFKLDITNENKPVVSPYVDSEGFLSQNHNHLYQLQNKIILTSDNGIYEYGSATGKFKPAAFLQNIFKHKNINYLKEDKYGNIWFCENDNNLGVIDRSGTAPRIFYFPELNEKLMSGGFENVMVIDSANVLIAAEQGFFHLNYAKYKKLKQPLQVLIRKVALLEPDSLLFGGVRYGSDTKATPHISHRYNSIHFEFSSPRYDRLETTTFSFYLQGFDKQWSDWARKNEKDYTNLPAGQYTFLVKCRNNANNESLAVSYTFTILPPWYQTGWAYLFFAVLFVAVIYLFYKKQQQKYIRRQQLKLAEQQRKYAEEQKQQAFLHQIEIGENEKKIVQLNNEKLQAEIELSKNERELTNLRNEKLQTEVTHKNAELASSAMNLVRKMEVFSRLKEDLHQYKLNASSERGAKDFQKIIRLIDEELEHNEEWEQFAVHFDNVHTNYLKTLKERYPELTASELKLSAYLRLNLSTKEIAQLMNISIRGVETSRYRLRKKLGISNETNLFDHLIKVTD